MTSVPGRVLLASTLEEDIAAVLDRYERSGYALAACTVEDVALVAGSDVDSASVVLVVEEGPLVKIDEVTDRREQGNTFRRDPPRNAHRCGESSTSRNASPASARGLSG